MLGSTLVITVNSVEKTLKLINQDGYTSEYLLRESTQEFRAKVRHSKEKALLAGRQMDRHNVELTQTIYADGDTPARVRQVYVVFRNSIDDAAASVEYLTDALSVWLQANASALVNWES